MRASQDRNEGVCQLLETSVTDALLQYVCVLLNGLKQLQGADLQANGRECGTGRSVSHLTS